MVKSSGAARPSVTLRLKYADSTPSISPESLLTVVPSGNRICTGGKSPPPAWWLDERCFAVEHAGEEPRALRAHNLARVLVDERICAVTQDSSFRHLHV